VIKNEWIEFTGSFIATGDGTTLSFISIFSTTTVGNFLDDIRVIASVPEPLTFVLLALGLVGLSFSRKLVNR
jgi:hypothetical protein